MASEARRKGRAKAEGGSWPTRLTLELMVGLKAGRGQQGQQRRSRLGQSPIVTIHANSKADAEFFKWIAAIDAYSGAETDAEGGSQSMMLARKPTTRRKSERIHLGWQLSRRLGQRRIAGIADIGARSGARR